MTKIIVFVVEGPSDQIALEEPIGTMINDLYDNFDVRFCRINTDTYADGEGGDITTVNYPGHNRVEPKDLAKAFYDLIIRPFFDVYGLLPEDIFEIIHIVDTDGAYIPNHLVIQVARNKLINNKSTCYYDERIECANAADIKDRNTKKRRNLNLLSTNNYFHFTVKNNSVESVAFSNSNNKTSKSRNERIITVPYSVYYFSSNLDHYINGNANMKKSKKNGSAESFLNDHRKPKVFVRYFSKDTVNKDKNYSESWDYIKETNTVNSLQRHSNLCVLLRDHLSRPDKST